MNKYSKLIYKNVKIIFIFCIVVLQLFIGLNSNNVNIASASEINSDFDKIYISQNNYDEDMKNIAEPYINGKLENGYIDGDEGIKLYYEKYKVDNAKGNIVICHGYTESLEKYHELIYYFMKSGYNVFGIEHRGHGRSGTLGIADKTQLNVKDFNQYVTDFKGFMDQVVIPNDENKKVLLFAHSMGGAIGTKFLEEYPNYFNGAVLDSPMLEVNTGKIPKFLADIIVKTQVFLGNGGKYVLGKGPYTPDYKINEIGTSCIPRYEHYHNIMVDDETFQRGGASYNWTNEAFKATEEIVKSENASKVEIPVLLFQAGQDTYVKPGGQNKFAEAAKNCEIIKFENSRHEIYLEKDEIQKPLLESTLEFYKNI